MQRVVRLYFTTPFPMFKSCLILAFINSKLSIHDCRWHDCSEGIIRNSLIRLSETSDISDKTTKRVSPASFSLGFYPLKCTGNDLAELVKLSWTPLKTPVCAIEPIESGKPGWTSWICHLPAVGDLAISKP